MRRCSARRELALFATALMARQNLNGPNAAPGVPGVLVWAITGVQIIPAYAESGPVGGTVRAFVGPVMAAMLWHLAMGIELRHRKPDASSNGFGALVAREVRERLLSRLGIAERHRNAAQITRDRATARAVALAAAARRDSARSGGRRGADDGSPADCPWLWLVPRWGRMASNAASCSTSWRPAATPQPSR